MVKSLVEQSALKVKKEKSSLSPPFHYFIQVHFSLKEGREQGRKGGRERGERGERGEREREKEREREREETENKNIFLKNYEERHEFRFLEIRTEEKKEGRQAE
jgi:hypothetical protein